MRYKLIKDKQWKEIRKKYNLTSRESQVAMLVCRGLKNDEIAKELKIAIGTVKTHLRNVYRRVRVNGKVSLFLRFAEDLGINNPQ